jgi:hypothetical protein
MVIIAAPFSAGTRSGARHKAICVRRARDDQEALRMAQDMLPNWGKPSRSGTCRKSSDMMVSGPVKLSGIWESFSLAAMSISVRKRLKDRCRDMAVDGTGRLDAASSASSETEHDIRRVRSRISKRVEAGATATTAGWPGSGSISALPVLLAPSGAWRRAKTVRAQASWLPSAFWLPGCYASDSWPFKFSSCTRGCQLRTYQAALAQRSRSTSMGAPSGE